MDNEQKKKFVERCNEAFDLADQVIRKRHEKFVDEYRHSAYNTVFKIAYEEIKNMEEE